MFETSEVWTEPEGNPSSHHQNMGMSSSTIFSLRSLIVTWPDLASGKIRVLRRNEPDH
jgi:hypothetical protein